MKKCPHCDKFLMASILPQCSWCGGEFKENELRKTKEEILGEESQIQSKEFAEDI